MPIPFYIIDGINLEGISGTILNFIKGSALDHQRYLAIWAREGYDVQNSDFLRWLFGQQGNNTQRAGALTVDMLNGLELIIMESAVWKTASPGSGGISGLGSMYGTGASSVASPVVIGPIIWILIAALATYLAKRK